jgi:two-component system, response regulator PdtaR
MRILIVEDDRLLAAGLAMMVESAGHEVVGHAATVRAAMDLARSHTPDLTLMDIDLGLGGSGIAAARGMKKHHGLVSLFVTEHPERARQATDAALGVLAKPYDQDTVLRTLDVASALLARRQPPGGLPAELVLPARLELFPVESASGSKANASIEMGR